MFLTTIPKKGYFVLVYEDILLSVPEGFPNRETKNLFWG